jgi:hypothetical protein
VAIQLHFVVELKVTFLDGLLDPHPEDPEIIDGV